MVALDDEPPWKQLLRRDAHQASDGVGCATHGPAVEKRPDAVRGQAVGALELSDRAVLNAYASLDHLWVSSLLGLHGMSPSASRNRDNHPSKPNMQEGKSLNAGSLSPFAERLRSVIPTGKASAIARAAGISGSTLDGYLRGQMPSAERAIVLADALGVRLRWLINGDGPMTPGHLFDANDHDWVMVPRYDARFFGEEGKGDPIETYPIRLDWLNRHARSSKDLWITEMPTHYIPGNVPQEGDTIICRDVSHREGLGLFLYLFDGAPLVRYFVLPDPPAHDPALGETAPRVWNLSAPENDPPGMRVVAKILGSIKLQGA